MRFKEDQLFHYYNPYGIVVETGSQLERQRGEHGKVTRVISPNGRWLELKLNSG